MHMMRTCHQVNCGSGERGLESRRKNLQFTKKEKCEPCLPPSPSSDKQGSALTQAPPVKIIITYFQSSSVNQSHPLLIRVTHCQPLPTLSPIANHPSPIVNIFTRCQWSSVLLKVRSLRPLTSSLFPSSRVALFLLSPLSGDTHLCFFAVLAIRKDRDGTAGAVASMAGHPSVFALLAHLSTLITIYPQFSGQSANANILGVNHHWRNHFT